MRIRKEDISRIILVYSICVLLAIIAKVVAYVTWSGFGEWINDTAIGRFAVIYVVPGEMPIWQVAAGINSVLAIGLFIFAGSALFRIEHDQAWPEGHVVRVLRVSTAVRGVFSLYTIACTLYITVRAASDWNWPPLGTKVFPWF